MGQRTLAPYWSSQSAVVVLQERHPGEGDRSPTGAADAAGEGARRQHLEVDLGARVVGQLDPDPVGGLVVGVGRPDEVARLAQGPDVVVAGGVSDAGVLAGPRDVHDDTLERAAVLVADRARDVVGGRELHLDRHRRRFRVGLTVVGHVGEGVAAPVAGGGGVGECRGRAGERAVLRAGEHAEGQGVAVGVGAGEGQGKGRVPGGGEGLGGGGGGLVGGVTADHEAERRQTVGGRIDLPCIGVQGHGQLDPGTIHQVQHCSGRGPGGSYGRPIVTGPVYVAVVAMS